MKLARRLADQTFDIFEAGIRGQPVQRVGHIALDARKEQHFRREARLRFDKAAQQQEQPTAPHKVIL
jgi:hypothetical protein